MATARELLIYKDTYNLVREIYLATHKFSREFKYCLGEQINRDALELLSHIFRANHIPEKRIHYLERFMASLDMIHVEFRLCVDMKVISIRQAAHFAVLVEKVTKQAAAWQKYHKSHYNQQEDF